MLTEMLMFKNIFTCYGMYVTLLTNCLYSVQRIIMKMQTLSYNHIF